MSNLIVVYLLFTFKPAAVLLARSPEQACAMKRDKDAIVYRAIWSADSYQDPEIRIVHLVCEGKSK